MNILFLIFHGFSEANGISKKIYSQINALKECGHNVKLCSYIVDKDGYRKRMIDNDVLENYGNHLFAKIKKRICYQSIINYAVENEIQFVYIRSDHNANPFTIHLIKKLKRNNIKVVMEIPTYPYDQEYNGTEWHKRLNLTIDRYFRKELSKQLNKIVTFSNFKKIFNASTIQISNGIDFEQIKIKETIDNQQVLNLIGVAEVHYWHGYDRLIKGLGEYYAQTNPLIEVNFHLIGGIWPNDLVKFKEMIIQYNIEKHVLFYGQRFGEELDSLFNLSQIGVGSLARHRTGITNIKTLKNREYAARGIPFIYSEIDDDFENRPYILKVPADDSPIDIQRIVSLYNSHQFDPMEIRKSIQHLSWKEQMQKVINETFNISHVQSNI